VARIVGTTDQWAVFGYEAGAGMVGLTAPARRVGWFADRDTPEKLTADGWKLFEAAARWSTGRDAPLVSSCLGRPDGASCSDGNPCNGAEVCQASICVFAAAPVTEGVLTQRNDNRRTGATLTESVLSTSNVSRGLQRLFSLDVEGQIIAQPLYARGVRVGTADRNVLYVVTMANHAYAFDADSGALIAHRALDGRPYRMFDGGSCGGIANPFFGLAATPVIDPATNTLFLISKTDDAPAITDPRPHPASFHLHALDLASLADRPGSPLLITDESNIPNAADATKLTTFRARLQNSRPGLLLDHGFLYLGFAALPFDDQPWHGFVFAYTYDGALFTRVGAISFSTVANGGGVWQAGNGMPADPSGNVYAQTGNTATVNMSSITELGEGIVKVAPGATGLAGTPYIPPDSDVLNAEDMDLGSSGPLLLPSTGAGGFRLLGAGKQGLFTLHELANISVDVQRFRATFNQHAMLPILQAHDTGARAFYPHVHSTPVVWERAVGGGTETRVYTWGERDVLRGYLYDKASGFALQPLAMSDYPNSNCLQSPCFTSPDVPFKAQHASPDLAFNGVHGVSHKGPNGMPGGMLSISANGTDAASGIVWANINTVGDSEAEFAPGVLRAYRAEPVSGKLVELWNNKDEAAYFMAKFTPPTIFNGRVYLPVNTVAGVNMSVPFRPASPPNTCGSAWTTDPADVHGRVFVYTVCPAPLVGQGGACVCPGGSVDDGNGNCVCPPGQELRNGQCECPPGQLPVGGICRACNGQGSCAEQIDECHTDARCPSGDATCICLCENGASCNGIPCQPLQICPP
jgi:hypothetical protein